jgi:energy-coupling factor transporter ATP-binding protein EcfA2
METEKKELLESIKLINQKIENYIKINLALEQQFKYYKNSKSHIVNIFEEVFKELEENYDKINFPIESAEKINIFFIKFKNELSEFSYDKPFVNENGDIDTPIDLNGIDDNTLSHYTASFFRHLNGKYSSFSNLGLETLKKLDYFHQNLTLIGANGSGKTSLSLWLKKSLKFKSTFIAAQRIMIIPTFDSISNSKITAINLDKIQNTDKSLKETFDPKDENSSDKVLSKVTKEFKDLLANLIAQKRKLESDYINDIKKNREANDKMPESKLDIILEIWNDLISGKKIECSDGINITVLEIKNNITYEAYKMSDGEKAILYNAAQVIQTIDKGIIIVDEPEIHLHHTITSQLWNKLELLRNDCRFIYITHDLDFALSRVNSKKKWIKSFEHPDKWEINDIIKNDIPEALYIKLLGSKKPILFCESEKGKIDEKVYTILFPKYKVIPVGGCLKVINYTKTFNKTKLGGEKAIGFIDSDHHPKKRLKSLKENSIFNFSFAEIENLFFSEDFLKIYTNQNKGIVDEIKTKIIKDLNLKKELQASNYITAKIDYYFKDSNITKANNLKTLKENYFSFTNKIDIESIYKERITELEKIISDKDYDKAIRILNDKGLESLISSIVDTNNYLEEAIKFLADNESSKDVLREYFDISI